MSVLRPELFSGECRKLAAAVARDLILVDADASANDKPQFVADAGRREKPIGSMLKNVLPLGHLELSPQETFKKPGGTQN